MGLGDPLIINSVLNFHMSSQSYSHREKVVLPSVIRMTFLLRRKRLAEWLCLHTAHAQT